MKAFGIARIGKDVELRYTPNGDAVANLALAFTYGKKGQDGNRPTQWVDASLWGKRAESLAPYLTKGSQIFVQLSDVHLQTYESKTGQGSKLVAKIDDVELISAKNSATRPVQNEMPQFKPQPALPPTELADIQDEIPF